MYTPHHADIAPVVSAARIVRRRYLRDLLRDAQAAIVAGLESDKVEDFDYSIWEAHWLLGDAIRDLCQNGAPPAA